MKTAVSQKQKAKASSAVTATAGGSATNKPFDAMNNIVANMLLNLTRYTCSDTGLQTYIPNQVSFLFVPPFSLSCSASRFEGSLNVDLNEITMNLVPFPRLHYLVSAMSPLYTSKDIGLPPRKSGNQILHETHDDQHCPSFSL